MSYVARFDPDVGEGTPSSVTVFAEKVLINEKPPEPTKEETRLVLVNSCLLALLMLLITGWFYAHVRTFVTGTIVFGTATAWSLLQVFMNVVSTPWKDDGKAIRSRLLARASTRWHLGFFIAAAIVLLFLTTSVHVRMGDTDQRTVAIRVTENGVGGLIPMIRLSDDINIAGRPFISWKPREVTLEVVQPSDFHALSTRLSRGEPEYLRFPESFRRKTLVRIYVPYALWEFAPPITDPTYKQTTLFIKIDHAETPYPEVAANEFWYRPVYVGLSAKDGGFAQKRVRETNAGFGAARRGELEGLVEEPAEIAKYVSANTAQWAVLPNWELDKTHTVKARLVVTGKEMMNCTAAVVETSIADCVMQETK